MSQLAVERILGRMVTDGDFRAEFFVEPIGLCRVHGFELTSVELAALLRVDPEALETLAAQLDPKIVRAASVHTDRRIDPTPRPGPSSERRWNRHTR